MIAGGTLHCAQLVPARPSYVHHHNTVLLYQPRGLSHFNLSRYFRASGNSIDSEMSPQKVVCTEV